MVNSSYKCTTFSHSKAENAENGDRENGDALEEKSEKGSSRKGVTSRKGVKQERGQPLYCGLWLVKVSPWQDHYALSLREQFTM